MSAASSIGQKAAYFARRGVAWAVIAERLRCTEGEARAAAEAWEGRGTPTGGTATVSPSAAQSPATTATASPTTSSPPAPPSRPAAAGVPPPSVSAPPQRTPSAAPPDTPSYVAPPGPTLAKSTPATDDRIYAELGARMAMVAARKADDERREIEQCEQSLYRFVQVFWDEAEPTRTFIPAWYVRTICEFLEDVARGKVRRGLLNCPPGVGKSLLVTVLFPAWMWTWRPGWRGLFTSHNGDYARRDSIRCRRVVESAAYKRMWPGVVLAGDMNRTDKFENTKGGFRQAQGVLGATGDRVNFVCIDDPYTVEEYHSPARRDSVHRWWSEAIPSRLDDKRRDALFVVMQRLGGNDFSQFVMDKGYVRRSLSAEYDPKDPEELAPGDPRRHPGEVLFPELQPRVVLDELKRDDMTEASFSAQYNQKPIDLEGGMFPARWWRFWKPDGVEVDREARPDGCADVTARALPPKFDQVVASVDCAFRAAAHNDWVVMQVWGCLGVDRYLLEQVRDHLDAVQTAVRLADLVDRRKVTRVLIEGKAAGDAVISMLQGKVAGIVCIDPEGGKESRAFAVQPQVEGGNVFLPDGWSGLDAWVAEFAAFPRGKHDDQVDAMTQALNYLRSGRGFADRIRALCQL